MVRALTIRKTAILGGLLFVCNIVFGQNDRRPSVKNIFFKTYVCTPPINDSLTISTRQRGVLRFDLEPIPLSMGDSFVFVLKHGVDSFKTKTVYPTIQYTYLDGDSYTFSCWVEKNGQKSTPLILPIIIQKTLLEQQWFQLAMLLSGALLVFGFSFLWLQYNYRQKIREQKMLLRISFDLHDRIGSALTSISVWAKILKRDAQHLLDVESNQNLNKIITTSNETVTALRETVWAINPDYKDMGELFEKMRGTAFDVLQPQGITVAFDTVEADIKKMNISMGQRGAVFLIFKEIINNITKHAAAKNVDINLKREEYQVRFSIQDNGKGFDMGKVGNGHGLKSLINRAKEHFIELIIESEPGKGTIIIMVIPEL